MGRREVPVPDGPLRDFAEDLRRLRREADMTYRALSARAGYSPSVLAAAAAGNLLPTLPVTLAFVGACGGDQAAWQSRWEQLARTLRATHPGLLHPEPSGAREEEQSQHPDAQQTSARSSATAPVAEQPARSSATEPPPIRRPQRHDPRRVGRFRVLGRLGGGAMGEVFLAAGPARRPAALKLIRAELARDPLFRRRFAAELSAARSVSGASCPPVVGADAEAQRPWMATEFVAAPPLHEIVERFGPLPEAAVFALAAGVAEALVAIHAAGIVHRDLKPSNILWDGQGPKVIDFGVSRALEGTALTATGHQVGTAGYTAPEQAERGQALPAGDVFALGCVLAYAATGHAAFGEGTGHEVLYRVIHQEPAPEAVACGDERLRELILACLDKDPAARPSPAQIIEACRGAAAPPPAPPVAEMIAERGRCAARLISRSRALRRTRLGLAALAAAIAALIPILLLSEHGAPHPNAATVRAGTGASPSAPRPGSSADQASSAQPTASTTSASPARVVSPGPSSGNARRSTAAPSTQSQGGVGVQAPAPTASSGPRCASAGATELALYNAPDGDGWHGVTDASAPNGCGTPVYTTLSGQTDTWQDNADWVFQPGNGASCTVKVHIPASSAASATAHYWVYDVDTTTGAHGNELLEHDPVDQGANRGAWVTLGTVTTTTGTLDVELVDNGTGSGTIAGDNAELFCS